MPRGGALGLALALALAARAHADPPKPPACTDDARLDGPGGKRSAHAPNPRDFVGKTAAAITERLGAPGCKSPLKWRYWLPPGCAYEKDVLTLRFAHGVVARATIVHVVTGEECVILD